MYLGVVELIRRLDLPPSGEGELHVRPLQHADAAELTKTLTEIISAAEQPGAAGPGGFGRGGSNLILVLAPYIIREQSDLRAVFEGKMHRSGRRFLTATSS